ncbi:hypothetical protein HER39_11975 [Arthrobacter deserti]|uniref:23S rRNA (Guanosine(2251)-2'-O)-methyltransferase RlmB n=1 Tax=Arthrobacter deserti TaxID=1742687 RepID=A0ABX1JRF9_9MICC|nr:hypothetical protein [Arthrobacter deserti]
MPDKSHYRHERKKPAKGQTIKQKRAEKRAKGAADAAIDPVAHLKKR